ncbi:maltose alpha-D-glucosyltransferase [Thermomicrobium sp. CFH 73360]|uniref:maltose alpha-D-glucosyltransferase n=1 Tax=Thermomicrobium sp. CFH 73360 TaxID=2951987 RepID=UPI002076FB45|nr:maltose alpha-D-glucosyltransferase [Thermomicrobium sp. CFH 73360]MCM8745874.1 maltose alpha-D-glucosyltransferase [Thermomicrobium sp. CFH 73360]
MAVKVAERRRATPVPQLPDDPLWYKDAILYELHVRAFYDSNGDGIGDFPGLTQKLDYLEDLGITAVWLLPFYPSPLRDDGYDIADYTDVHPAYGTLRDVKEFIREAHRRGIRVITELVLNHTSDQHPWFQRARRAAPGSVWRNFYVWSDTPEKYKEARIIFKDFETSNWAWDPVAKAYYWHRFYSHQPDLNYENPAVRRAILRVLDFWMRLGVDGMRLDAVPYLYEREGTNCENLPETHAFLKELRRSVDSRYRNRMLLAEANQWPEDAVAYFGQGDECHMAFHFPLMPRLFMAIRMEDRFPIVDILSQTPAIPDTAQWALFLRNHDELTLEMVTDEERDYMYRVYARDPVARINLGIRRRLAPLLGNNRRRIELMNGLLFSLPGTPVIYYGDEIGMGDNVYLGDRNGVRTPMQWSADRNAGFSTAPRQRLYLPVIVDAEYHYEAVNVEAQQANPHSLLWWMKRLIALRKQFKAFGRGSFEFIPVDNRKVLAYVRRYEQETILVVANLSRFVQWAELDLSAYRGMVPIELFGRIEFPPIGEEPYRVMLGPHSFYWFSLERPRAGEELLVVTPSELPVIPVREREGTLDLSTAQRTLLDELPRYLRARRWFAGKARRIKQVQIADQIPLPVDGLAVTLLLLSVEYTEGDPELYVLPLAIARGDLARDLIERTPHAVIARTVPDETALLVDALAVPSFSRNLIEQIGRRRRFRGEHGTVVGQPTTAFRRLVGQGTPLPEPVLGRAEQSNTSVIFPERVLLKLYRKIEPGPNPELELERALSERLGFRSVPPLAGSLDYRPASGEAMTLAVLLGYVPNEGDAWQYTLDMLAGFLERALAYSEEPPSIGLDAEALLTRAASSPPPIVYELIDTYVESAHLLGQRTAELHRALARLTDDPAFAPEPFSMLYQRSLYQAMRSQLLQTFTLLRDRLAQLPEHVRNEAETVLQREREIVQVYQRLLQQLLPAQRIRCHGDYHLGQVLYTGRDFVIIDFEGEPARPLSERRLKRSPLTDVAGMLRSFHYAASATLFDQLQRGLLSDMARAEAWLRFWYGWVAAAFLQGYLEGLQSTTLIPTDPKQLAVLLEANLLDKAIYELRYELGHRPGWLAIPLRGILELLRAREGGA